MHIINTKEFRANQKKYFDLAIKEDVIIRRGRKQAFILVPLDGDEYTITPELQARIDKAREQYEKGNFVGCSTKDELRAHLATPYPPSPLTPRAQGIIKHRQYETRLLIGLCFVMLHKRPSTRTKEAPKNGANHRTAVAQTPIGRAKPHAKSYNGTHHHAQRARKTALNGRLHCRCSPLLACKRQPEPAPVAAHAHTSNEPICHTRHQLQPRWSTRRMAWPKLLRAKLPRNLSSHACKARCPGGR